MGHLNEVQRIEISIMIRYVDKVRTDSEDCQIFRTNHFTVFNKHNKPHFQERGPVQDTTNFH